MEIKYIIDTNVPLQAAKNLEGMSEIEARCKECCFNFIEKFIHNPTSQIVLDDGYEICNEYVRNIPLNFSPSIATMFMKWVFSYIKMIPTADLIHLNKSGDKTYREFPAHEALKRFDKDDRKFIALSSAHVNHPPIVQGTDYKWKMYSEVFLGFGIHIIFLCPEYIDQRIASR
jgi:hypothetical protein